MTSVFEAQATFMECCEQEFNNNTARLYKALIDEEYKEFCEAYESGNKTDTFKELCDLVVVIAGYAAADKLPMDAGMDAVFSSNFSKIDPLTMKPYERRDDGKVLKGPNYVAPDLEKVLYE